MATTKPRSDYKVGARIHLTTKAGAVVPATVSGIKSTPTGAFILCRYKDEKGEVATYLARPKMVKSRH